MSPIVNKKSIEPECAHYERCALNVAVEGTKIRRSSLDWNLKLGTLTLVANLLSPLGLGSKRLDIVLSFCFTTLYQHASQEHAASCTTAIRPGCSRHTPRVHAASPTRPVSKTPGNHERRSESQSKRTK